MMSYKEKYRELCEQEKSIPIFSQPWWLDVVCGDDHWDVAMVEKGGYVQAAMPYSFKKRYGFTIITQPLLTQTLGPWMVPSEAKYANRLGVQKDLMEELIRQLPQYSYFCQNWNYSQTNWLPFYWAGFMQTTRYTYILPDLSDTDLLWSNMRDPLRREIKKAQCRYAVAVRDDLDLDAFLPLQQMTFARQGIKNPVSVEFAHRLDEACVRNNCRKIWMAEDNAGRFHAGAYIVWDKNSAYYIMGGGDPGLRTSGAASLCLWEAIKHAAIVTNQFDFEGSMIEPVERFFRAFGAIQTPYFQIKKTASKLLRTYQCITSFMSEP